MLIQWFKNRKKITILFSFLLSINTLNALSIGSITNSLQNSASKKIEADIKNKIGSINLNGIIKGGLKEKDIGFLSSILSTIFNAKINVKCLMPHFKAKAYSYSVCGLKDKFNFNLGPCSIKSDFSENPLYKKFNSMCNKKSIETGISADSFVNTAFAGMMTAKALDNGISPELIKYGNNITFKDAYGDKNGNKGSYFVEVAKLYPHSTDAQAILNNNKKLLLIKDALIKVKGTTDLNKAGLPKNLTLYKEAITNNAKIYRQTIPNSVDIISTVQSVLTSSDCLKYIKNSDGTINYNNYLDYYVNYVNKKDGDIDKLYQSIDNAINYEYANKLIILKAKSKYYEYAPTENHFKIIPDTKKPDFLYKSLVWTSQETDLLGQREREKERAHEKIRIMLRKAYIASMPFDEVKAVNELNQLLQEK